MNTQGALVLAAWEAALPPDDPDRDYILQGVREGFRITSKTYDGPQIWEQNYESATGPAYRERVQEQVQEELDNGRYVQCKVSPKIISALGAIPKPGGDKIRLIHDCSRPEGRAVNDLAEAPEIRYQTLREAADIIEPGFYMAKVDLKSAYRTVRVHPADYVVTGLSWRFGPDLPPVVMRDERLPFGAKLAPAVFHRLSQAIRRILASQGHQGVIAYLDDFLIISQTAAQCQQVLVELMSLVRRLGFSINYNKVEGPSRLITFLGVEINTDVYTLGLPEERVNELLCEARDFVNRRGATKRQLQSIAGKLNWAAQVVRGGRPHMRRLLDLITPLRAANHRCRLTRAAKCDLEWWIRFLSVFNGTTPIQDTRPLTPVCLDACPVAGGGYFDGEWFHVRWDHWEGASPLHINYKEVLALEPAAWLWGSKWANQRVTVHSDNQAAVGIINRGTAKHPFIMAALRRVFWLSAFHNFHIRAVYYPGERNTLADAASRLHEPGALSRLSTALAGTLLR